ncbi:helix-turn-helix domain-containing protein [Streptomyces sp. NPDC055400]
MRDLQRLLAAPRSGPGAASVGRSVPSAAELFISVKTVQYHLTHIYTKLGIRSRGELAALRRDEA